MAYKPSLKPFDAETQKKTAGVQRLQFTTCFKMESSKYSLSQQVIDVLTAYLIIHCPFMKKLQANGLGGQLAELIPTYKQNLDEMLALTNRYILCPVWKYMVRFTDISTRPDHVHVWRTGSLNERECTCRGWHDQRFPCVHAVKATAHHGMHMLELCDFVEYTTLEYRKTYFHRFLPLVNELAIEQDTPLRIPKVLLAEEELGKRGRKPGPKPKHKRKTARPGSCASPAIVMTQ
ncbi:LOW QUALITY PROTEIN: hypothetical protein PHMEG_0006356 [Phytophthora megakarya]|uniref:SWIM-type domain-containing protein n=1 Tax=Phytophthora megakarya TaxID=4795 RepID=A0A225WQP4_9STRA|nr:LOW QUALITY PROTEIN: hypothetical protein PHMEG_0006356 [Phytophthora megakarya]